jgi:hypothetical protein
VARARAGASQPRIIDQERIHAACALHTTTMNPHISLPRPNGGATNFGGTAPSSRRESLRMPRFFKRLFKFPQMDFEMALWEMLNLIIAPQKVFRSIYYHVNTSYLSYPCAPNSLNTDLNRNVRHPPCEQPP